MYFSSSFLGMWPNEESSSTREKFVQIFNDMRIYTMQQGRIGAGSCSCSQDMVAGEFGGTW
jgi:hypothetical protein